MLEDAVTAAPRFASTGTSHASGSMAEWPLTLKNSHRIEHPQSLPTSKTSPLSRDGDIPLRPHQHLSSFKGDVNTKQEFRSNSYHPQSGVKDHYSDQSQFLYSISQLPHLITLGSVTLTF